MKLAYFIAPHIGGTWTVYQSVRAALRSNGADVRWLGVGPAAKAALQDPLWTGERETGSVVGSDTTDELAQARELIKAVSEGGYDGVFVNAACNRVHSNVVRYLDPAIRRIMTVHNITIGTYAGAAAIRDWVHATVCVSPRIRDDLVQRHGFPSDATVCIPNAIDLEPYAELPPPVAASPTLQMLSLGRVIDTDKGVFWLPRILDQLVDAPVSLSIAGDGPDLNELQRRCAPYGSRVRFLGRIAPADVPAVMSEHDVFLLPSRFEGLGLALVEAMAAGCVPVASRIRGVTDFVVRDGSDGFLFDIGNVKRAATLVRRLADDRSLLAGMSRTARRNVTGRFDLKSMMVSYSDLVNSVLVRPSTIRPPLPLAQWHIPTGLRPGLRSYLPRGVKNSLRVLRERFA